MPRVERARLIERPPTVLPALGSARRSKRSISKPRRPRKVASKPPARPLPTRTNLGTIKNGLIRNHESREFRERREIRKGSGAEHHSRKKRLDTGQRAWLRAVRHGKRTALTRSPAGRVKPL